MAHNTVAFQVRIPKGDLDWLRKKSEENDRTVAQELRHMIKIRKQGDK